MVIQASCQALGELVADGACMNIIAAKASFVTVLFCDANSCVYGREFSLSKVESHVHTTTVSVPTGFRLDLTSAALQPLLASPAMKLVYNKNLSVILTILCCASRLTALH